jgi:hypothetical protein
MPELNQREDKQKEKRNFFESMMEVFGWVQIVASPLSLGIVIGAIIYLSQPNSTRLAIAVSAASIGLIIGIIWATRVWKRDGTMRFLSRTMETPDIDDEENTITEKS